MKNIEAEEIKAEEKEVGLIYENLRKNIFNSAINSALFIGIEWGINLATLSPRHC